MKILLLLKKILPVKQQNKTQFNKNRKSKAHFRHCFGMKKIGTIGNNTFIIKLVYEK